MSLRKDVFELATVVASFVLLAVSTRPIVAAVDYAWTEEGLVYRLTAVLGGPFGGNLDVPVLLVVGLLTGWLLLFCLDGTKRVQALFVVVGIGVPFGLFVEQTGRIVEAIERTPWAVVVSLVVGLTSAVVTSSRFYGVKRPPELSVTEKLRWLQFPAAGGAFLYGMTAIVVVAVVDFVVTATGFLDELAVGVAGLVFVVSLSVFLRYDRRRTTMVVSPPDLEGAQKYQPYVLGGLFERARQEQHGFPIEGDGELLAARSASSLTDLDVRFDGSVVFGFVSSMLEGFSGIPNWIYDKWLLRTVIIESEGWTTNQIGDIDTDAGSNFLPERLEVVVQQLRYSLWQLLPVPIREWLRGPDGSVLERLSGADTILLVGPTLRRDETPPEGCKTISALCERFASRGDTDIVLATTEASPVADEEELMMDNGQFKRTVAVHRLGIDSSTYQEIAVIPTDRFDEDRPTAQPNPGFDDLLREVS